MNSSLAFPPDGDLAWGINLRGAPQDGPDAAGNRFKNGSSVVADAPGGPPLRRNRKHDDAEPEYRQSHEFEYQRVHGNSPYKPLDL